ncbi:NADPH-dependent glutamate synthase [Candidatus Woesearchaeota archaeon]|nr:NADPH-dependent glutamate synthase [Candidatus Woesearchaeota archaeon]
MRTPVKEQEASERIKNFKEVCLGYSEEEAVSEASRCLQCANPQCVTGCPVSIDIPGFIRLIKEKKFSEACTKIKEKNNLPGVCGRVCPQEDQCEGKCILGKNDDPVNIGKLERFAADNEEKKEVRKREKSKTVAVIGSGPAGLTCAADLAKKGYSVKIFEALHDTGGVLRYGIPEFRLPNRIVDDEVEYVKNLGVEIEVNSVVGKTMSFKSLLDNFDAIFIGVGAGLPYFMGIEGENLQNVYSANEFLTRNNLMNAKEFPNFITPVKKAKHCVVVGGGNVAMDAARTAKRLGADVTVVYRRSEKEMPARIEEVEHAKEEGIKFELLTNPVRILGEEKAEGIECVRMELGEEDESGRRRPVKVEGSNFTLDCDQVIIAIGQGPNPLLVKQLELQRGRKGDLIVDEDMKTNNPKVWAAGDITSGAATVIEAMGDAKKAATSIDKYLKG